MLGPGPRLIKKKNLPGHGLTEVEKHYTTPPTLSRPREWDIINAEADRVI